MAASIAGAVQAPLRWLSIAVARVSEGVVVVLSVVMIGSLLAGVLFRYGFEAPLSWPGEIALLSFSWIVLLAASLGVRDGFHVRVAILHDAMPEPVSRILHWFILLVVIGFGIVLLLTGYRLAVLTLGQLSPAAGYPLWILNASVPVSGLCIVVHGIARLFMSGRVDS